MAAPYGTKLKITRLDNKKKKNKSVIVSVIDKNYTSRAGGRPVHGGSQAARYCPGWSSGSKVEVVGRSSTVPEPSKEGRRSSGTPPKKLRFHPVMTRLKPHGKPMRPRLRKTTPPAAGTRNEAPAAGTSLLIKGARSAMNIRNTGCTASSQQPARQRLPRRTGVFLNHHENVFRQVADLTSKWFDNIPISINPALTVVLKVIPTFDSGKRRDNYRKNLYSKNKNQRVLW